MFNFEKLNVYQKSLEFAYQVYKLTNNFPLKYQFNISSQFERAVLSIPLNIAEGSSGTNKDFAHFLSQVRDSCYECIPLIFLISKLQLINNQKQEMLYNEIVTIAKMLTSLKNSIK